MALNFFVLSSCAKQSGQGLLLNLPYREARNVILENGWKPAEVRSSENDDVYGISRYLSQGYTEVVACSGTGKGHCRFVFQNDIGLFMEVTTQEAPLAPDIAVMEDRGGGVVVYYGITDKIDR